MEPKLYRHSKCYSTNKVTFFLYNLSGQIVGYQHYRPDKDKARSNHPQYARYYTLVRKGVIGVFGLELLKRDDKTIYIVEGIFKAAVLHRLGFNAVAVLTANPKPLVSWFKALRGRYRLLAIGDGDKAGAELVKIVGAGSCSTVDLDEMDDSAILRFLETLG